MIFLKTTFFITLFLQQRIYASLVASLALLFTTTFAVAHDGADHSHSAPKAQPPPYSMEQMLLFAKPHLANIESKATLHYSFEQSGSQTDNLKDAIVLDITGVSEIGGKNIEVSFLSGENNRPYRKRVGFRSNPLLMFFLQWDVEKMDDNSGISHHYFRSTMRDAFLTDIASEEIDIKVDERTVKAHKIFFTPLQKHQGDIRYKYLPQKYYEFILSDAVPGGIYSISTLTPDAKPNRSSDSEESVTPLEYTLIQFERLEQSEPINAN